MTTQDFYSQDNASSSSEWVSARDMKTLLEDLDAPPSALVEAILAARQEDAMLAAQPRPEDPDDHSQDEDTPAGWMPFLKKSIFGGVAIVLLVMLLVVAFKVIPGFTEQPKDAGKTPVATLPQVFPNTPKTPPGADKTSPPTSSMPTKQRQADATVITETPTLSPSPEATSPPTPTLTPTSTPHPTVQVISPWIEEDSQRLRLGVGIPVTLSITSTSPVTASVHISPTPSITSTSLMTSSVPITPALSITPTLLSLKSITQTVFITPSQVMTGVLSLRDEEGNEFYSLNYVVYPTVKRNGYIRQLPSLQSVQITPLPASDTPLLVIGVTMSDSSGYRWLKVQWRDDNNMGTEGWLRQDVAIDIHTRNSLERSKINKWIKSQVVPEYPWPVPGEYQADAFTLYNDHQQNPEKKIVALPQGGTVYVLSNNHDLQQAHVEDNFVNVKVTFWVPKEWYESEQWQKPEEESELKKICWSVGGSCSKDDPEFNFNYFNQQRITPNPISQNDWLQVTVKGWMKKDRILSEETSQ